MNVTTYDINELKRRMSGAQAVLKQELSGLRTGRASAHLLDAVHVDAYGQNMPLNQLAPPAEMLRPTPHMESGNSVLRAVPNHQQMNYETGSGVLPEVQVAPLPPRQSRSRSIPQLFQP